MWLALWAGSFPLGSMTGATFGGWLQDRTGRKSTQGLGCLMSIGAITICYLSDRTANPQASYFGGKMTQGMAVGILGVSTQTYLSEVVPARLRGPIMALFPAFQLVGQLLAAVVALTRTGIEGPSSYRVAIASEYPLSLIPLTLAIVLPESPAWLIRKNKMAAAQASFRKIHGATVAANHQDLFDDMSKAITEEMWVNHERKPTYIECFRGHNFKRTMIVVFSNFVSELMGFPILGNVSYFIQLLGVSELASFVLAIVGIILGLGGNVASFWTLLKFGRRFLIISTLSIVGIFWGTIGIAGCFEGPAVGWYTAAAMMVVIVLCGLGCWPASFVVAAETSSLTLRSKTSGVGYLLGGIVQGGFAVATPYLYNPDAGDLGGKTGFVFLGTAFLGVAFTYFFIPELKGKTAVEIDRVFEKQEGSLRRVNTNQFERVDSEENNSIGLSNVHSRGDSVNSTTYQNAPPAEAWEPLRKRPTF